MTHRGHTERNSDTLARISSIMAAGTMLCGDSQSDMPATRNADRPKPPKPRTDSGEYRDQDGIDDDGQRPRKKRCDHREGRSQPAADSCGAR